MGFCAAMVCCASTTQSICNTYGGEGGLDLGVPWCCLLIYFTWLAICIGVLVWVGKFGKGRAEEGEEKRGPLVLSVKGKNGAWSCDSKVCLASNRVENMPIQCHLIFWNIVKMLTNYRRAHIYHKENEFRLLLDNKKVVTW